MKLYTLDQCIDKSIGEKGTVERERFDAEVKEELEAYYRIQKGTRLKDGNIIREYTMS